MSTFAELIREPSSKKIALVELDVGSTQEFWVNWRAGSWKINFDVLYSSDPEIDSDYLNGLSSRTVTRIGSVLSDGEKLTLVASTSELQTTEASFYWDGDANDLYIHLENGDEPSIHSLNVGETIGVSNIEGVYNGIVYESRLLGLPQVAKTKDPLFFGKISFDGGALSVDNRDGEYDEIGETWDIFGNAARILVGFDELAYGDFQKVFSGYIESAIIGPDTLEVQLTDTRKSLSKKIPDKEFDQTTYTDLKDSNIGKSIPIGYGVMLGVPAICTNEEESAPSDYSFKLFDMSHHGSINEITTVYVEGVEKTPSATDLAAATFDLDSGDYTPGDEVTVDCKGYEDSEGALIQNALDIIVDLLTIHFPIYYTATYFNTTEWDAAQALAPNVNYFAEKPVEIIEIIEEICNSARAYFIIQDDGLYTARVYDSARTISQIIQRDEVLEVPTIEYDPTEILTSTNVGYAKQWSGDEFRYLHDLSQESDIYKIFKVKKEETFETLLINSTDAQTFSDTILALSGSVQRIFQIVTKWQPIQREVGDFVRVEVYRARSKMLGICKAEVIGISKDLSEMKVTLTCRLISVYGDITVAVNQIVGGGEILEPNIFVA